MKENYIKLEVDKDMRFEQLLTMIEEIKESRERLSELFEGQVEIMKTKIGNQ